MNKICKCGGVIWDGTLICDSCHERNKAKERGVSYEPLYIVERPMYRVIISIVGDDIDVDIQLTAKGKRYARGRAYGHHRRIESEDDAMAEILHARDNYYPEAKRPDKVFEARF